MKIDVTDEYYEKLRFWKVGPKGRTAVVPEGWHLVARGPVLAGDKYANTVTAKWFDLEPDDMLMQAQDFDALIRQVKL